MSLKLGIVGLPNIGKSTLFNAITNSMKAEAANYPFCTIEPNEERVFLKDERLETIAKMASSEKIIPNFLEVVDIAGLVKGASKGEGLGNKFLSHIREVNAILHLVRCFEESNITHVENRIDPISDIEIINTELTLSDLEQAQNIKNRNKKPTKEFEVLMEKILKALNEGKSLRFLQFTEEEQLIIKPYNFITLKPVIYVANVGEESITHGNELSNKVKEFALRENAKFEVISVKIESEIGQIEEEEEKQNFLEMIGLKESGLNKIVKIAFETLNLITYFTVGPKEARSWTIKKGTKAPGAAGVIHTDFEKGFIKAEIISYEDYIQYNGEQGAKEAGKLRAEGKEYTMKDGDVTHFRFNV